MKFTRFMTLSAALLVSTACSAQPEKELSKEPVKSIDIYVLPYYSSQHGKTDLANVYNKINALLLKNTLQDYQQAVTIVEQKPEFVTPMTMFALSVQAYNLGQRDESVKWFYRGQNRLITTLSVLDLPKQNVAEYTAFSTLVGQFVNSYAYCNLSKQRQIAKAQIEWTKKYPYQSLFLENLPSQKSDRKAALKEAEKQLDQRLVQQDQFFANPKQKAEWEQARRENYVAERFCW